VTGDALAVVADALGYHPVTTARLAIDWEAAILGSL
jgi:hypothetical protein